jgi:hypothetical protein
MSENTINFKHPEYENNIASWNMVNNICDSKNLGQYLTKINPQDDSEQNKNRNDQFKLRAIFYAIAGYTSRGLVGKAFSKPPECKLETVLEYMKYNVDGMGTTLEQQSQDATRDVTRIGRAGLFVDFPNSGGQVSKAQMESGGIFSTITKFDAGQIINWQTMRYGAKVVLAKVVLAYNSEVKTPDGFGFEEVDTRMELKLSIIDGALVYSTVKWTYRPTDGGLGKKWVPEQEIFPRDSGGRLLTEIPFVFIGSESNTQKVDPAPMHDLAQINKGHYNNSASYEDSVFVVGQAQPWMSGITQGHIDLLKSNQMYTGSGFLMGVPSGEQYGFAQPEPNTLVREAMIDKLNMMVGLGAMFITPGTTAKTATQSNGEQFAQHSILSLIVSNVSDGYKKAFKFAALFMGGTGESVFEINKHFVAPNADANMIREVVASFMGGTMPQIDFFNWQKKHGLISEEKVFEEYVEELDRAPMVDLGE